MRTLKPRPRHRALRVLGWLVLAVLLALMVLGYRAARSVWSYADHAAYWQQRAEQPGDLLYVALGDSLAQGIGADEPARGYVGLLADDLQVATGRSVRVVNLSVTGATAHDVAHDQLPELARLLTRADPVLVTLDVGAGDVDVTTPQQFSASMRQVLAALPPGSLVADVPDYGGGPGVAQGRALSVVVRDLLVEHPDLVPVALQDATTGMGLSDWGGDLFHPSDAGYLRYLDAFRAASDLV